MTSQALDDLPQKAVPRTLRLKDPALTSPGAMEWIFSEYCEKLIFKNEALQEMRQKFHQRLDHAEFQQCLTDGQKMLLSLGALDGQVKNGGITQFFWNDPDIAFTVADALQTLGATQLLTLYQRAFAAWVEKQGDWINLRNRAFQDSAKPDWKPFQQSYDLLDLSWFDDAYLDKYHQDAQSGTSLAIPGLGTGLLDMLVRYVKEHKNEFIVES